MSDEKTTEVAAGEAEAFPTPEAEEELTNGMEADDD